MESLDAYERPPDSIRTVYKKYQKLKIQDIDRDPDIVDLSREVSTNLEGKIRVVQHLDPEQLTAAFYAFGGDKPHCETPMSPIPVYEHEDMPGLHLVPSLLPPEVQLALLSRLLHRDLSQPQHLTNIHTHYNVTYPPAKSSFFTIPLRCPDVVAHPLDPSIHRPLVISQLLNKKMRWMTLGGQYDWTQKRYPDSEPPAFPMDIQQLLRSIFTDTKAEAAIVNLYSPGDTLSAHRDVAESSPTGLISISLGCDAIFIIGTSQSPTSSQRDPNGLVSGPIEDEILAIRLHSGSAVYMSGSSRFAWHGVPQIIPGTCPVYLKDWPACDNDEGSPYEEWKGWMETKRVNLNVRQMRD